MELTRINATGELKKPGGRLLLDLFSDVIEVIHNFFNVEKLHLNPSHFVTKTFEVNVSGHFIRIILSGGQT